MKIVIDALSVFSGGGLTSMIDLLPALERVDREDEYVVIVSVKQAVIRHIPERFRAHTVEFDPRNILIRLLYEQLVLPFVLWRMSADLLYSVGNLTSLLAPCRILLLIENANPYSVLNIGWCRRERLRHWALRTLGALSARRAATVRFLSARSRDIICGLTGIQMRKTTVIPHGVALLNGRVSEALDYKNLPHRFILTVSNIGPHKNLHTLVDGFEGLVEHYHYPGSLVIVGAKLYPEYFQSLTSKIHQARLDSRVVFLDWVDPEKLPSLYKRAEVFVFPSVEETFGIPVVEAMGYGVPVLVPSPGQDGKGFFVPYEELCGPAAQYFDPFRSQSLCEQLNIVLTDERRREQMIVTGKERVKQFRWDDIASDLVNAFRNVDSQVRV